MTLNTTNVKKLMPLAKFEFNLFKTFIQLEDSLKLQNKKILLNLQISGGQDSIALLNAISRMLNSKRCKFKNKYFLVAQHFNHKQRGFESDEDAFFSSNECLKRGIPIHIHNLNKDAVYENFQDYARNWRREEAKKLAANLASELKCDKFFILTAHHARDHVETILLHLLRGSGIHGLKGISLLDENEQYLRPFYNISYQNLTNYVKENKITFREDSSNNSDKYRRNYIRKHILPHFEYLQQDYENSFIKLSRNVHSVLDQLLVNCSQEKKINSFTVNKDTKIVEIYNKLCEMTNSKNLSENSIKNIFHEAQILLSYKKNNLKKEIKIKGDRTIQLQKIEHTVKISMQTGLQKIEVK